LPDSKTSPSADGSNHESLKAWTVSTTRLRRCALLNSRNCLCVQCACRSCLPRVTARVSHTTPITTQNHCTVACRSRRNWADVGSSKMSKSSADTDSGPPWRCFRWRFLLSYRAVHLHLPSSTLPEQRRHYIRTHATTHPAARGPEKCLDHCVFHTPRLRQQLHMRTAIESSIGRWSTRCSRFERL
jgi:hypothetical protein